MTTQLSLVTAALLLAHNVGRAGEASVPAHSIPAQAEVSAVKSPVKLTLSVYKTELKLKEDFKTDIDFERLDREHPRNVDERAQDGIDLDQYERRVPIKVGEPLWIKIRLTNVGKKTMVVKDDLFTGPLTFPEALEANSRYGVSIVITGPDGKSVPLEGFRDPSTKPCSGSTSAIDPVATAKAAAWRKEGKSQEQIDDLFDDEIRAEEMRKKKWEMSRHPIKKLNPGESVTTGPWRYQGSCAGQGARSPQHVGDYAQLANFHLDFPGVYKIRAVYFDDPYRRSGGTEIGFKTPSIKITVRP